MRVYSKEVVELYLELDDGTEFPYNYLYDTLLNIDTGNFTEIPIELESVLLGNKVVKYTGDSQYIKDEGFMKFFMDVKSALYHAVQ